MALFRGVWLLQIQRKRVSNLFATSPSTMTDALLIPTIEFRAGLPFGMPKSAGIQGCKKRAMFRIWKLFVVRVGIFQTVFTVECIWWHSCVCSSGYIVLQVLLGSYCSWDLCLNGLDSWKEFLHLPRLPVDGVKFTTSLITFSRLHNVRRRFGAEHSKGKQIDNVFKGHLCMLLVVPTWLRESVLNE